MTDAVCRQIHFTRHFSHALLHTIILCIRIAWLKTSRPKCLCSAHSCHPRCVGDCLLAASSFCPSPVSLSVVYLFSSTLHLHSDQHFLSNANSVEGTNHSAFAQRGVLPCGDIPSSHKKKHHERRQTTTERLLK